MSTPSDNPEFDDIERQGPYVVSEKAVMEMRRLATEHNLSFTHNPGGGEFNGRGFRCQIGTNNDIEDLAKLREALAKLREALANRSIP